MEIEFEEEELFELFQVRLDKPLRGKQKYPIQIIQSYQDRVNLLYSIERLEVLKFIPGARFEYLKGDRKGQCSLRLNNQYRLIITPIDKDKIKIILINEISKHYE